MRADKPLPVLYTPSQGERGKCWPLKPKLDQDRTHGHSRVRLRPSLCLDLCKGVMTVKPENSVNYYYAVQALRLLVERGLLSEMEYDKASRYCAGIFQPERGYI